MKKPILNKEIDRLQKNSYLKELFNHLQKSKLKFYQWYSPQIDKDFNFCIYENYEEEKKKLDDEEKFAYEEYARILKGLENEQQ